MSTVSSSAQAAPVSGHFIFFFLCLSGIKTALRRAGFELKVQEFNAETAGQELSTGDSVLK
jgi:hypothetical protein